MKKRGSIIIAMEKRGMEARNFLYMLGRYSHINEFEIIIAYEKTEKKMMKDIIEDYFSGVEIYLDPVKNVEYKSRVYNLAARYARTDSLIFLDTNVVLTEACLELLCEALEQEEDVLAVQPMIVRMHTTQVLSTGYFFTGKSVRHALEGRSMEEEIVNISDKRNALATTVLAVNRYVFEELNGFNEKIPFEQIGREFSMRITDMGYQNFYNHEAKFFYHSSENTKDEFQWRGDFLCEICHNTRSYGDRDYGVIQKKQMEGIDKKYGYMVLNFSDLIDWYEVFKRLDLRVKRGICYSQVSEFKNIIFQNVLSSDMAERSWNYIFLTNNFHQIYQNEEWFSRRRKQQDLVIDLAGNVIKLNELRKNY